ncbi:MAG: glycosyltransferase family 2 protein [Candidatus Magnetoovum sp. WYHC-5]|nr:glycosyltransferase family 2 protein [Candidatus Magnetoovum sp. WYHC-5]
MLKEYFYNLLFKYISLYIMPEDSVVEVAPANDYIGRKLTNYSILDRNIDSKGINTDYILLNGLLHYERNIYGLFKDIKSQASSGTRLIIIYYSTLWKPLIKLASMLGIRTKTEEANWLSHEDTTNLLHLTGFEPIRRDGWVLLPIYIPIVSDLLNRFIAPLPFFNIFAMVNVLIARPLLQEKPTRQPSVSVVVPARNESGNVDALFNRLPKMGPDDELIIVEGNSTDDTWYKIEEAYTKYKDKINIIIAKQDGKGKGDAVRKGFSLSTKDILMILDADLTVAPEDLPKFYDAIVSGKGEFINGSRLVYPMEDEAMQFFNILGNKFFALAFSYLLGQRFKDTLCGTKVLSRDNYLKIAKHRKYFGEFDPFGDFDLLFGAARAGFKIVELPIPYHNRNYGETNISRWKHGSILFVMLMFALKKFKFI